MTSKEIVIKLIDNTLITGEEAYVLLNDLFKAEMVAVNETLKECNKQGGHNNWDKIYKSITLPTSTPIWCGGPTALTGCNNNLVDASASTI